ncbi:MAG: hypothetical protein PVI97_05955 [Candidatus Thiodiazotropha sp.]
MKKISVLLLCLFAGTTHAALLTFDDITTTGGGSYDMPNIPSSRWPSGYQGFLFSTNLDTINASYRGFGAHSGDFALLNNRRGSTGYIHAFDGGDFTFGGLWAKRWLTATESGGTDSLFGTISGFRDGVMVWSVDTSLNGSYEYYAQQSGLIDELRLGLGDSDRFFSFLVDDLVLDSVSPVPLPAAFWLFGAGLLSFFGFSRGIKGIKKHK